MFISLSPFHGHFPTALDSTRRFVGPIGTQGFGAEVDLTDASNRGVQVASDDATYVTNSTEFVEA